MICAGRQLAAHQPLYSGARCAGLQTSLYVYPPWVAQTTAQLVQWIGEPILMVLYIIVFILSILFLFWSAFVNEGFHADRRAVIPFLSFNSGLTLFIGNIAVVVQAGVVAGALWLGADSILCLAAITISSLIKPIYLTYLMLPVLSSAGILRKVVSVLAVSLIALALAFSNLPGVPEWRALVLQATVYSDPGGGFLRWFGDFGVHDRTALILIYAIYASLMFSAALSIAYFGKLDRIARLWLGVSFAVMLMPRMMAYDLIPLGAGLAVALSASRRLGQVFAGRLNGVVIGAAVVYLVSSLIGGPAQVGHSLSLVTIAGALIALGAALFRRRSSLVLDEQQPDLAVAAAPA